MNNQPVPGAHFVMQVERLLPNYPRKDSSIGLNKNGDIPFFFVGKALWFSSKCMTRLGLSCTVVHKMERWSFFLVNTESSTRVSEGCGAL